MMTQDMIRSANASTIRTTVAFAVATAMGLMAPPANATPEGWEFQTAAGTVFQSGPADQTVTNVFLPGPASQPNNRHIISWDSLNLGSQETLNYLGLDGFAVLNRVNANMGATQINGALNAMNGNVYIVNQAGVMFGQNATINVGSIYAAGGDILDSDFSAGVDHFFNLTGELSFGGTLNASDKVALFGSRVVNTGAISGRMITMAVGNDILINDLDSRISLRIDGQEMDATVDQGAGSVTPDLTGQAGVSNSGTIETSDGGGVTLAAGDLYGLAIHHSGEINSSGGTVDLVAAGGAVWTDNTNPDVGVPGSISTSTFFTDAGAVNIAGPAVVIGSQVEAVGGNGAISVIGHDNVIFDGVGSLIADGGSFGASDGGTINVQAVDGTVYGAQGTVMSVKGGAVGGNGGAITVQGESLAILSEMKVGAVNGAAGSLTLISGGRTNIDATNDALPTWDMSDLSVAIVGAGAYGRIGAGDGQTLRTVDGHLLVSSADELRFEASMEDLRQTATFQSSDLRFAIDGAGAAIRADDALEFDGGGVFEQSVELSSGTSIGLRGGDYYGTGTAHVGILAAQSIAIENNLGTLGSELGHLTMSAQSLIDFGGHDTHDVQTVHVNGSFSLDGVLAGADLPLQVGAQDKLVFNVGGDLSVGNIGGQAISVQAQDNIEVNVGGHLFNAADVNTTGEMILTAGSLENHGVLHADSNLALIATTGSLETTNTLSTGADLLLQSFASLSNVHGLTTDGGSIALRSTNGDVSNTGTLNAATDIVLEAAAALDSGGGLTASDITLTSNGQLDVTASATASGSLSVASNAGDVNTTAAMSGQTVAVSSGGHTTIGDTIDANGVQIAAGQATTINAAVTAGDGGLTLSGDDGLAVNAQATSTDTVTLTAVNGDVTTTAGVSGDAITLNAGGDTSIDGQMSATTITMSSGGDTTLSEAVTAGAGGLDVTSAGTVVVDAQATSEGTLTLNATNGDVTTTATVTGDAIAISAGNDTSIGGEMNATAIAMSSGGDTTLNAAVTAGTGGLDIAGSGDVTINSETTSATDADVRSTAGSVNIHDTLNGASVALTAAADVSVAGQVTSTSGDITLNSGGQTSINGTIVSAGDATIDATLDIQGTGLVQAANALGMTAGGSALLDGQVQAGGATTLMAGADARLADFDGGDLTITSGGNTHMGSVQSTGLLEVTANGQASLEGDIDAATIDISGGSITQVADTTLRQTAAPDRQDHVVLSSSGDVTLSGAVDGSNVSINGADVSVAHVTSGSDLSLTGTGAVASTGSLNAAGVLYIVSGTTVNLAGATSGHTVSVDAGISATFDGSVTGESVSVFATEDIDINAAMTAGADGVSVESHGGAVTIHSSLASATGDVNVSGDEIVVFEDGDVSGQHVALDAGSAIATYGDINGDQGVTLGAQGIAVHGDLTSSNGNVTVAANETLIGGDVSGQTVSLSGDSGLTIDGQIDATDAWLASDNGSVVSNGVTTTSGTTNFNGESVEINGEVVAQGDVHVQGSAGIDVNADLTGAAVTLDAQTGSISVSSDVSGSSIAMTAQDTLTSDGTIDSTGDVSLTTGGNLLVNGDVNGADLTINAGGGLNIAALLQGDAVSLTGADYAYVADVEATSIDARSTTGLLELAGRFDATGDITLAGETIAVNGDVLAGNTLALMSTGDASLGSLTQADTVNLQAGGDLTMGGTTTGNTLQATAGGDLNATGALVGGEVTLTAGDSVVVVQAQADTLTVTGGADVTVADISTNGLASIEAGQTVTHSGTSDVGALEILADATMLEGTVLSQNHASINSDSINLTGDTAIMAVTDLVLASRDNGLATMAIDNAALTMNAGGTLSLLGTVDGTGGQLSAIGGDGLLIGGDLGANRSLDSIELTSSRLQLGGFGSGAYDGTYWQVQTIDADGDIHLNATNLETLSELPTVFGFGTGVWSQPAGSLSISSGQGDIVVGHNQGLSYYGDLTLDAGGDLHVGNVTALGDLTLRGDNINVWQEIPGQLLEPGGAAVLVVTSLVSGGVLTVDGQLDVPTAIAGGPLFAGVLGTSGVPLSSRTTIVAFDGSAMRLVDGGVNRTTILALDALPPVSPGESDLIASEQLVHDDPEVQYLVGNEDLTSLVALADLGVAVQDTLDTVLADTQRARAGLITANLAGADATGRVQVSRNRINVRHANAAVRAWNSVLASAPTAGDVSSVGRDLNDAWTTYAAKAGDQATETGFEAWARDGDSPIQVRANAYISGMRDAFTRLELAGLTRSELAVARTFVTHQLEQQPTTTETVSNLEQVDIRPAG